MLHYRWSITGVLILRSLIRAPECVTVSEIGARLSWAGPYLEAVNIVMQRQTEARVRRVQILLDLPATVVAMEPVISEFVLDEGKSSKN